MLQAISMTMANAMAMGLALANSMGMALATVMVMAMTVSMTMATAMGIILLWKTLMTRLKEFGDVAGVDAVAIVGVDTIGVAGQHRADPALDVAVSGARATFNTLQGSDQVGMG